MAVKRFEDLIVWQKAQDLAVLVFETYKLNKDYSFKDQIWRASISISNNISEGFDRSSNPDFIRFLNIARTSYNEVKSMLYLACRIQYINDLQKDNFISKTEEISRIIFALIKTLK